MLRRRAQSDERRRRVLTDDATSDASRGNAGSRKSSANKARYSSDALERQIRISDLVPQRAWIYPLLFLAAASVSGGLVASHYWQQTHSRTDLGMLDVTAAGSLAGWLAAILLATAAAVSLICYSLRRHRQSDYHTRYRVWFWIAAAMVLMSAASTTAWHVAVAAVIAESTGWIPPGGIAVIWLAPVALCLATLAIRLMLELRGCRIATLGAITVALAYATVLAFEMGLDVGLSVTTAAMVVHGGQLFGHTVLLFSFLWYARYVVLDIQGLVPVKEKPTTAVKKKLDTPEQKRRVDKAHADPPAPKGRSDLEPDMQPTRRAAKIVAEEEYDDDEMVEQHSRRSKSKRNNRSRRKQQASEYDEYEGEPQQRQRRMSKAERKRQRKLKTRQRDAA